MRAHLHLKTEFFLSLFTLQLHAHTTGKAMDDYVTVTNRVFEGGAHKVQQEEGVPAAEAPAAAPALAVA